MTNTETAAKWFTAAPLKKSKKQAAADLEYCIKDPAKRAAYRIVKLGSKWAIQYPIA